MKKNSWGWTFVVSGGHLWVDYYQNMLPSLLPFIAIIWGLNNSQLALLVSVQSVTANFMQPVFGFFSERMHPRWSLGLAIIIAAIPMCFLYLSGNYLAFLFMVAISGIGSAWYHPLGASNSVRGIKSDKALKMSIYSGMGNFGFSISPALTAIAVTAWGIKGLVIMLIPGLIWAVVLFITSSSDKKAHTDKPDDKVLETEEKDDYKPLILLSLIVGLRSWLVISTTAFIPLWIVAQGASENTAGMALSIYLLSGTIGGFASGFLYKQFTPEKLLIVSFILSLFFLPLFFWVAPSYKVFMLILLGLFLTGTTPVTVVIGQELLPKKEAFASGITMGLAWGLGGVGASLTGVFADIWGTVTALLVTSAVLIPACFLAFKLLEMKKSMKISQENCENNNTASA